jgi:hypothetical protein
VKRITTPLDTSHLVPNDAALLRCNTALELSHAGDYKRALEVMRPLWPSIEQRPQTDALHPSVIAELYLCVATLIRQIKKSAQDEQLHTLTQQLLNESLSYYQAATDRQKIAAGQIELGYSYAYAGEFNQARTQLNQALEKLKTNGKTKSKALAAQAELEYLAGKYHTAFKILTDSSALVNKTGDRIDKAIHHYQLALALEKRASLEDRTDLLQQAATHYQSAAEGLRLSKDLPARIELEIKLANALHQTKRNAASHQHLNKARRLATSIRDKSNTARVDQIQASLLLSEKKYLQSEALSKRAAHFFTRTNKPANASAAITLQAVALTHLKKPSRARYLFQQAFQIADQTNAAVEAGIALLSMIETLDDLTSNELHTTYLQARKNLSLCSEQAILLRLLRAADKLILEKPPKVDEETAETSQKSKGLQADVLAFERAKIQEALSQTDGKVTLAATLLKTSYQSLSYIINTRHQELLTERSPVRHRASRRPHTNSQTAAS